MEKVYIIYEEENYGDTKITCVFATLERAKSYLKKRAKFWITDETALKETLTDIDEVTDLDLVSNGDLDYFVRLEDLGITYYLHREPVL
jgi:hypothetical protein